MTSLHVMSSTIQAASTAEVPSKRREAVDSKARDDNISIVSEQKVRPSSSGNREEISANLGVKLAKSSGAARYDPMMRWKAETPNEEPWNSRVLSAKFQGVRQSS